MNGTLGRRLPVAILVETDPPAPGVTGVARHGAAAGWLQHGRTLSGDVTRVP